jgi:uncharacterized OsmC-like protein
VGHARGEVELEDRVLLIKRIHVTYTGLAFEEQDREKVERVLRVHADACPVARSIRGSIEVTTALG